MIWGWHRDNKFNSNVLHLRILKTNKWGFLVESFICRTEAICYKARSYLEKSEGPQDHGIWSHHFMANRWGNKRNGDRFYFLGLQNHCGRWLQPWNYYYYYFSFIFYFFPFIFISWRLITLQYCSGFCHTLTWISHGFTCVPHPDPPSGLPPHPIPLGLPSAPALSTCLMHPTWAGGLFHPW